MKLEKITDSKIGRSVVAGIAALSLYASKADAAEIKTGFNAAETGIAFNAGANDPSIRSRIYTDVGYGSDSFRIAYEGLNEAEGSKDYYFGKHLVKMGSVKGFNAIAMARTTSDETIDKKVGIRYAFEKGRIDLTVGSGEFEIAAKYATPLGNNFYMILFDSARMKDGDITNFFEPTIEKYFKNRTFGLFARAEITTTAEGTKIGYVGGLIVPLK